MNRLAPNFTNIANINQVPTAGQVTTSLPAGNATVIDVVPYGSDPDNDSIQLYAVTPPAHGAASIVSGKIYYTSPNYYSGGDQFNYTILDGHGGYATNQVRVIVTFVNHAPIANNGAFTLYNTAAPLLNVTAFAYDLDQGDNVHVSAVSAPSHGSAVIQSGLVKYTPATNYIGLDSFIYTVTDTHNTNTTASISLTVKGLPAASVVTVSVNEESAILIDVLAAATDPNGDSLSIASLSTPGHGTAVIQAGQALYTPTPYYVGSDSFTYSVTDGTGGNATASVQITVLHINHAPVANNNAAQIYVNSPTTISVIANDSDYDNDSLTVISATTPSHGTTIIQANEALYTPSTDYHGSDSFNYTITDGNGGSASAQVMVSILQLPFIQPIAATLDENSNKLINVLDGSSDANGYNLDLYSVTTPAHGSATIQSGQVLYTPTLYYFGADSFNYTVSNAHNGYSSQIVSITITRIDIPPVVADFVQVTPINASVSIDVLAQASTPQSSTLSILSVETPSNGIANIVSGQISYTPNANYHGQDTFSYTVTDNYNEQNIGNITIFMNTIPVANMDSKNITQNQAQQLDVLGNDIDDDGDSLTLVSVTPAAHGLVNIVNNQAFYIPNTGYVGTDSFNYTVADGYPSGYANATVDLQINAPEDSTYAAFVGFATSTAGIATFAAVGAALLIGTITGIVFAVRHHNAKKIDSLYHDTLSGQSIALSTFALTAANAHSAQAEALPQHHQDAVGEYAIEAEHPLHAQQAEAPIF